MNVRWNNFLTTTLSYNASAARRWAKIIGIGMIALGCLVIVGWLFDITFLKCISPNFVPMKPNTAISFLMVGLTLWLIQKSPPGFSKRLIQIFPPLILLIGLLTLGEYFFAWPLSIDQFLYHFIVAGSDALTIPRMSEATAIGIILLGLSLFLLVNTRRYVATQLTALLALAIGLLATTGYLFGAASLYSVSLFNSMALHTSLGFIAAGLAILLNCSDNGFIAVVTQNHLGGVMARRLLPAVILIPIIVGWLRLQGQYLGYYNTEFGAALYAVAYVIILTFIVWLVARVLNRIDVQHQLATRQLERYSQRMDILHHIDRGIIASHDIPDLIDSTIKDLRMIIPCQRVAINLLEESSGELVTYVVDSDHAPLSVNRIKILPELLEGFDRNNTRKVDDIRLELDRQPTFKIFLERGLLSLCQVLLVQDGTIQGTLSLGSNKTNFFTPDYCEIAVEVADQLSVAVKEMRLSNKLDYHLNELETTKIALQNSNDTLEHRVTTRTAELNSAKEQVEAILNNSSDAILLTDLKFIVQKANTAFARLFGWREDEIRGKSLHEIVATEDKTRVASAVQAALAGADKNTVEIRVRRRDNSIFEAELSIGHVEDDGLVSTIHDITERKAQERQLRYHAGIQNTVADAVIVTDLEYHIQSWNKAAERMYGWRMEEVVGKTVREVLQTEFSASQFADEVRRVFVENGQWSGEVRHRRRDGSQIYVLSSTVLFKDSNNIPFGVLAVNRDISDRKQAETALQVALNHEKEVNEMKTRFISIASHEFRTPLATILMATESLIVYRQRMDAEKIDQKLDKIRTQIIHVAAIMDDVLTSSKLQSNSIDYKPLKNTLDSLCREIVQEFAEHPEFTNRIEYMSNNPTQMCSFDARLMRQVIVNLLSNALKYSTGDKLVHVNLDQTAERVKLEVIDQGIGIPVQDQKYIFEPFHRAQNVGEIPGTGLGMNITQKAVELHGGTISVTSEINQGSTFTVILPATQSPINSNSS